MMMSRIRCHLMVPCLKDCCSMESTRTSSVGLAYVSGYDSEFEYLNLEGEKSV